MFEIVAAFYLLFPDLKKMNDAYQLTQTRHYEESIEELKKVNQKKLFPVWQKYYHYFLLLNYAQMNDRTNARKELATINNLFLEPNQNMAEERHRALLFLMAEEIAHWKDDDLLDIARDMGFAGKSIEPTKAGKAVQERQKIIVEKLSKFIEKNEPPDSDSDGKSGRSKKDKNNGRTQGKDPKQGPRPQEDSIGGTEGGKGLVDQQKLKYIAGVWGKLPEKDRAKAMMELTRDLPPRYREIIENYSKSLARGHQNKK